MKMLTYHIKQNLDNHELIEIPTQMFDPLIFLLSILISTCSLALRLQNFFMLNSIEHKKLIAHMYENIKKCSIFSSSDTPRMLFSCS